MAGGALSGAHAPTVTYDKDSPLGKLEDFGKKMEVLTLDLTVSYPLLSIAKKPARGGLLDVAGRL